MNEKRTPPAAADPTDLGNTPRTLRNPDLADSRRPIRGRPATAAEAASLPPANAASNGYWLHDAAGPRHYVGPEQADAPLDAARLIAAIEEQMGAVPGLDASRIHLSVSEGTVVLSGRIDSTESRRRAGACAVAVAGNVPVINRIVVTGR